MEEQDPSMRETKVKIEVDDAEQLALSWYRLQQHPQGKSTEHHNEVLSRGNMEEQVPAELKVEIDVAEEIPPSSYMRQQYSCDEQDDCSVVKVDDSRVEAEAAYFVENAGKTDIKQCSDFTCSCKLHNNQPCSLLFSQADLHDLRNCHLALQRDELDLVILSHICAGIHDGKTTMRLKQKVQTERKRIRVDYYHKGRKICRDTFFYTHGISKDRLTNLVSHYQQHGITVRTHGNKNCLPKHALTFQERVNIIRFIQNYAEQHAVLLPGRIPGYPGTDLKLLPSSCTKVSLYEFYTKSCRDANLQVVAQRTFCELWQTYVPEILSMKPSTDLCLTCRRNSALLNRSANVSEEEKLELITKARNHVEHAFQEREEYNRIKKKARDAVKDKGLSLRVPGDNTPDRSVDLFTHYSFGCTQQVHFPSNPQQPGSIFFKTPRKCGVFGVHAEALPQMVLFLMDEAVDTGKGANTVISLLDFFFTNYGMKETKVHLHADNCIIQNKNNAMIQYLLWRVVTGQHEKIALSFLIDGHTKFSPDWAFGVFKHKFRFTKVDCLQDIVNVVKNCSTAGIIIPHLCGTEDGQVFVPTRDWSTFLDKWFRKLVGLKHYHHFEFYPSGEVHARLTCKSEWQVVNLLKGTDRPERALAPIIQPKGLTEQRQQYLFNEIHEFVATEHQDKVCPAPFAFSSLPSAASVSAITIDNSEPSTSASSIPGEAKETCSRPKKSTKGLEAKGS